jgi:glycosyltransferase involved in cell wall biosynthesis
MRRRGFRQSDKGHNIIKNVRRISFIDLSPIRGGAEVSIEKLFERMKGREDITLFTSSESDAFRAEEKVQKIKIDERILLNKKNSLYAVYSFVKIAVTGIKTEMDFDIILTNTFKSHIFGLGQKIKNRKIKWIIFERDVPENVFIKILKNFLYKESDFVIFNSNYLKSMSAKTERSEVIYNLIESDGKEREERDFLKFAFMGNLTYEKGFDRTLEVFEKVRSKMPEAELFVSGEAGYGSEVKEKSGRNIVYFGYDKDKNCLNKSGFFILLNRKKESFSRAVAEAMMAGAIPVILKGNGMDEYADESNALIFEHYDAEKIAEGILNTIKAGKAEILSMNARKKINSILDFETTIFKFGALFDELTKNPGP